MAEMIVEVIDNGSPSVVPEVISGSVVVDIDPTDVPTPQPKVKSIIRTVSFTTNDAATEVFDISDVFDSGYISVIATTHGSTTPVHVSVLDNRPSAFTLYLLPCKVAWDEQELTIVFTFISGG